LRKYTPNLEQGSGVAKHVRLGKPCVSVRRAQEISLLVGGGNVALNCNGVLEMPNMAHCRFQNTLADLLDCAEHLQDQDLSHEEDFARRGLIELCRRIAELAPPADDDNDC
jgi:hypothetical protein